MPGCPRRAGWPDGEPQCCHLILRRRLVTPAWGIAARFPDLTLRAEAAHQEAFVRPNAAAMGGGGTQVEIAIEALFAWASEQHRQPTGGVRSVLVFNPANPAAGPDTEFAVSLR